MKRFVFGLIVGAVALGAYGKTYKLEGMVGGEYPIVIELEENDGFLSGRYAYVSTLKKNGNFDCSWLQINPSYEHPATQLDIRDCKLNPVETWYNVSLTEGKQLTARMKNVKGKTYNITAHVTESSNASPAMQAYFKENLGKCPSEFHMFFDPLIQDRWAEMMGQQNFDYLVSIYQTQGPVEYQKGMFYSSGFVAHQCCDPKVIWAYDSDIDAFYVWILKDSHEYWWSETGQIPLKFRELVSANS